MMEPVGYLTATSIGSPRTPWFAFHHGRPKWASEDKVPAVYAWVVRADTTSPEIIYLGKAGKGLVARCRQHEQGFKGKDGKGKSNGDKLMAYMAVGRVDVYAMWPEPALFRAIPIPSHSAVEDWLLSAIDRPPALNREAAAKARAEALAAGTHVPKRRKSAPAP
ncbi:hypothetical protein SAMN05192583_0061 [Sphingomonas gellani]|uniref:GIY-YIG domain-containing protein n=1 Tax=Sphingomonas gellani TaxID=1166340 RepID=A0A1H7Y2N0_9SPHN|nr:hypothetical protein [Sphingomonas gellani]SEM40263.1 hypothetical protein SAMN05192583_0061 [Sphingomonas gellani]